MVIDHNQQYDVPFYGLEVEKTKFYGLKTAFITYKAMTEIDFSKVDLPHIYLGANQSIIDECQAYTALRTAFFIIEKYNKCVTVDIPVNIKLNDTIIKESNHDNLVIMMSLKHHYDNIYIKLDNKFGVDEGVWVHKLSNLKKKENITEWNEYINDSLT